MIISKGIVFRFISKGIACISPGRWKLWRLEGVSLLTNTNNPLFLLVTSNWKGFLVLDKINWLSGNKESSFVSAIANMPKLLSNKWGILENLFLIEFILRYAKATHLGWLNLLFLGSLAKQKLLCADWSGKSQPVTQTQ